MGIANIAPSVLAKETPLTAPFNAYAPVSVSFVLVLATLLCNQFDSLAAQNQSANTTGLLAILVLVVYT